MAKRDLAKTGRSLRTVGTGIGRGAKTLESATHNSLGRGCIYAGEVIGGTAIPGLDPLTGLAAGVSEAVNQWGPESAKPYVVAGQAALLAFTCFDLVAGLIGTPSLGSLGESLNDGLVGLTLYRSLEHSTGGNGITSTIKRGYEALRGVGGRALESGQRRVNEYKKK